MEFYHHHGVLTTFRRHDTYIVNDEQSALRVHSDPAGGGLVSISPVPTFIDKRLSEPVPFPARDATRRFPWIPNEIIWNILDRAFLLLLSEQCFREACTVALDVHPFLVRQFYAQYINNERAPPNLVVAASRLSKTLGLLCVIWQQYFCSVDFEEPLLMKMSLFADHARGRPPRSFFRRHTSPHFTPPAPYQFVDGEEHVKLRNGLVRWLEDTPTSYSVPIYTRIGPRAASSFYGDVAVCVDAQRVGFFLQTVLVHPFFCFDLWLWSRQANAFIKLDLTTKELADDPYWNRFFRLCVASFSDAFGCMCLPGSDRFGGSSGQRVSSAFPRWVDLRDLV